MTLASRKSSLVALIISGKAEIGTQTSVFTAPDPGLVFLVDQYKLYLDKELEENNPFSKCLSSFSFCRIQVQCKPPNVITKNIINRFM